MDGVDLGQTEDALRRFRISAAIFIPRRCGEHFIVEPGAVVRHVISSKGNYLST